MDIDKFLEEQPPGTFRFYLKKQNGYVDANPMWEFYREGSPSIPIYIQGGNIPNPSTGRLPTCAMYSAYNEQTVTIDNIEKLEKV